MTAGVPTDRGRSAPADTVRLSDRGAGTVGRAFFATAERFADRPAISSMDGQTRMTWSDYADGVSATAAGLGGLDVERGDIIACWLSNRPEFHLVDMASVCLGAASF